MGPMPIPFIPRKQFGPEMPRRNRKPSFDPPESVPEFYSGAHLQYDRKILFTSQDIWMAKAKEFSVVYSTHKPYTSDTD